MNIDQDIRMLTIRQPFASLLLNGKTIETRYRLTNYRGLVLIHTGLVSYTSVEVDIISTMEQFLKIGSLYMDDKMNDNLIGHAIAIGNLIDCRPMNKIDEAEAFVEHHQSLYSWVFKDVKAIVPFKIKGSQGMNKLSLEQKKLIKFL